MTQLNNEDLLLDLYKIHAYIPNDAHGNPLTPFGNFCAGYEAAKADSESILKQQQNTIAKLEAANQWLKDNPRTDIVEMYEVKINSLEAKNSELSASINVLREAMQLENFAADSWANAFYNAFQYIKNLRNGLSDFDSAIDNLNLCEKDCQLNWNKADAIKTLASTPAQSLQAHDNDVIERCADIVENMHGCGWNTIAQAAWQAATAESDKRIAELKQRALEESNKYVAYCDLAEAKIAELKANTSQIVQAVSRAADAREAVMENEIIALQKHINVLREELETLYTSTRKGK